MFKTRILLINPPNLTEIPKFMSGISYYEWMKIKNAKYYDTPVDYFGLQKIAKYILYSNKNCEIYILNAIEEHHCSIQETMNEIKKYFPLDLVCFTGSFNVFTEIEYLVSKIKEQNSNVKTMYGQYYAASSYDIILEKYNFIDYVSTGQSQFSISKMINYIQGNEYMENIPNLAYREKNNIILNKVRKCM